MGLFSSGTAKRAAAVQARGQQEAEGLIRKQYETTAETYQPYMDAGTGALSQYQRLAGGLEAPTAEMGALAGQMDPIVQQIREGQFQESPGYAFRREEGRKALEQSAAARGGLFSGGTGKALERYGQNFATSEYDNWLGRLRGQLGDVQTQMGGREAALGAQYKNIGAYNPLIQTGYGATAGLGALGASAAQQQAGYRSGAAESQAGGMLAKSNQLMGLGQGILNLGTTAFGAMGGLGTGGIGGLGGMGGGGQSSFLR